MLAPPLGSSGHLTKTFLEMVIVTGAAGAVACAARTGTPQSLWVFRQILAWVSRRRNPEVRGDGTGIRGTRVRLRHSGSTAAACPVCAIRPISAGGAADSRNAGLVELLGVDRDVQGVRNGVEERNDSQLRRTMQERRNSSQPRHKMHGEARSVQAGKHRWTAGLAKPAVLHS